MRKKYLLVFLGTILLSSVLVLLFIAWVNPYRLSGWKNHEADSNLKPRPSAYLYEVKMANFLASSSDSIILGNSRADIGFDPEYSSWSGRTLATYNLAIPGTGLTTTQAQVAEILKSGKKIRMATFGVDFLDFLVQPQPIPEAGRPFEIKKSALDNWRWRLDTAFSVNALGDAFRTILIANKENPATLTAKGANPLLDYRAAARQEGYYTLFRQRAQENAKNFKARPQAIIHTNGKISRQLATLESIIDSLAANDTEVALVIYPYHAQILAMWEEVGLTAPFLQWKSELVRIVENVKKRHPNTTIQLWDFSGYHTYACETIPEKGDLKSETNWYWEGGHFKKELGDLILAKILNHADSSNEYSELDFGAVLDQKSLLTSHARYERNRVSCQLKQPKMFAEVRELMM